MNRTGGEPALALAHEEDVDDVLACIRDAAMRFGFDELRINLLTTAASELAMNAIRHARDGRLQLARTANGRGLTVVVEDRGPGITDLAAAFEDGFTTRDDGLGVGLGAVRRAAERLEIRPRTGGGVRAAATLFLPLPQERFAHASAGAARDGGRINHTTTFVREVDGDSLLFGVIGPTPPDALPRACERIESLPTEERDPSALVATLQQQARRRGCDDPDLVVGLLRPDQLEIATCGGAIWTTAAAQPERETTASGAIRVATNHDCTIACATRGVRLPEVLRVPAELHCDDVAEVLLERGAPRDRDSKLLVVRRLAEVAP